MGQPVGDGAWTLSGRFRLFANHGSQVPVARFEGGECAVTRRFCGAALRAGPCADPPGEATIGAEDGFALGICGAAQSFRRVAGRQWGDTHGALAGLFFVHALAMGMWFVPLSALLDAAGQGELRPYAFAASASAAFVSPLLFGAVADRHVSPVAVVRALSAGTAGMIGLTTWALEQGAPTGLVWLLIQGVALCMAPTFSLSTAIVFARLAGSGRPFGPLRAMATLGWMCGCWLVSLAGADGSVRSGYLCALAWLGLAAYTWVLPRVPPPAAEQARTWRERLGWDATELLRERDHRVVFVTAALFSVSLAALYPYTPPHLRTLGFQALSAWMSVAQVTEVVSLFLLAWLLARWRLKWTLALGLGFAVVRFGLCAWDRPGPVLLGVALHGVSFACVMITAQVYVAERIGSAWRARAQALLTLMTMGFGSLVGYLGCGVWYAICQVGPSVNWRWFWSGLGVWTAGVLVYFLAAYRGVGRPRGLPHAAPEGRTLHSSPPLSPAGS